MPRPPPISFAPHVPLTVLLCGSAVVVGLSELSGNHSDAFMMNESVFWAQPWRLVLSILPHGSPAHLFFNLYWCWTLGSIIETALGRRAWIAVVLISAVCSSAAEYTFTLGGIGLSGVVYGLFGTLWAVSRTVPRFRALMDRPTVNIFVVWFFVCILLTYLNWLPVANFAHGAGALAGLGLGLAIGCTGAKRLAAVGGVTAITTLSLLGASTWRSTLNFGSAAESRMQVLNLIESHRTREAIPLLEKLRVKEPNDPGLLYYLAVAYHEAGRTDEAVPLLTAAANQNFPQEFRADLAESAAFMASEVQYLDPFLASRLLETAVSLDPPNPTYRRMLNALRKGG